MKECVMIASAVAAGLVVAYLLLRKKEKRSHWKQVATVKKLYIHPVKSCRGLSVDNFLACAQGVMLPGSEIGDRTFMVIHEKGVFATSRQYPRLVLVKPTPTGRDRLKLEAPGMEPLEFSIPRCGDHADVRNYKVFGEACPATDCGDRVAQWIRDYLNVETARLVYHNKELPNNERRKLLPFKEYNVYTDGPLTSVFQDYSAFNVLSQASIDNLNERLEKSVNERSFRPNVLLEDCDAFAEDNWQRIRIGTAEFQFAKHDTRCMVTTIDPETGVKDEKMTVLETLKEYRQCLPEEKPLYGSAPKFSSDFVVVKEGEIRVGDKVYLCVDV